MTCHSPMPTCFAIGAAKSGTTSLCTLLDEHPQICVSRPKEPAVFLSDLSEGEIARNYQQCFADCPSTAVHRIDGTTAYSSTDARCAARIHTAVPDARLIYIVREPIARIESHWVQLCASGRRSATVPRPFTKAVLRVPDLVAASRYWEQIQRYRGHFDRSQILVLYFDDLIRDPTSVVLRCHAFLGVDLVDPQGGSVVHKPRIGNREEPVLFRRLRRAQLFGRLNEATSRRSATLRKLKRALKRSTLRPIPQPHWDRPALEEVIEKLRPDLEMFAREYGPLPPEWCWLLDAHASRERIESIT